MSARRYWVPLLASLLLMLSGCSKDDKEELPQPETTVLNKQVTLDLFTETDYSDSRWQDSKMKVSLSLRRVGPGKETVVLDTTMGWIAFRDLPTKTTRMQLVRKLDNVSKTTEDVVVSVSKLISINGYESTFAYKLTLERDKENETVAIKL